MNETHTSRASALPYFLLLAALAAAARASLGSYPLVPDETDILTPAFSFASGLGLTQGKYPDLPYLFYGVLFKAAFSLGLKNMAGLFALARAVNLILFPVAGLLFLACARRLFDGLWRSLALVLFLSTPCVFFSAVYVKSESFLLLEVLTAFLFAQKALDRPDRLLYAVLCGAATGLSLATKYNPFPALFYVAALVAALSRGASPRALVRPSVSFAAAALVAVAVCWPGVFHLLAGNDEVLADLYFSDLPSPFRAAGGLFAFPNGRVINPLLVIAPVSLGFFQYGAGIAGFAFGSRSRDFVILALPFFLCHLAALIFATANQFPWLFTPLAPFPALAATALIARFPKKIAPVAAVLALCICVYQAPAVLDLVRGVQNALLRAHRDAEKAGAGKQDLMVLVNSVLTRRAGLDARRIDEAVREKRPRFILAYGAYTQNFCINTDDPDYKRQCSFLHALDEGKAGYRVVWSSHNGFPMHFLLPLPEINAPFLFLERTSQGGSPHEDARP